VRYLTTLPFVRGELERDFFETKVIYFFHLLFYLEHGVYNMKSEGVVSRRRAAMSTMSKEMKELIGEHEAILVHMGALTRTADTLITQPARARERVWDYRQRLYDFKDAIWYHLDVDERIFKTLFGDAFLEDPTEEHQEIQRLVNDMIAIADNTNVEKLEPEELNQFCDKLGAAFKKVCKLIEVHIARENAILERVQKALNNQ
jgi:hypothetical protein